MTAVADGFVVIADVPVTAAQTTAASAMMTATIARVALFVVGGRRRQGPAAAVAIAGRDGRSRVVDLCLGRCL